MKKIFINRFYSPDSNTGGDVFSAWETFLQSIGAAIQSAATGLGNIVNNLNPSGLSADETAKIASDLSNIQTAAQALANAVTAAAPAAAQGAIPPVVDNSGSTN